jgi:serine/threonine-protein kinase
MADLSGQTLGNYLVHERVGRGGMAEVYKGYHKRLERNVAIKILHSFLAEGEDFLARFEREARAVAQLRHPNIVQIYDFSVEDDLLYMVMEYIDGGTLNDRLNELAKVNQLMPLEEVVSIIDQIANALDYAHNSELIHRDIKPSNILLAGDGKAFLTDFGIARIMSSTQFTATGTLVGTPAYMSPEQCRGETLTHRTDIYSLGIILFEMLTGRIPFDSETPLSLLQKHITDPIPALSEWRSDLSTEFEDVVRKALAKEPEERFQNANELNNALQKALRGFSILATHKGVVQTDSDSTSAPTVVSEPKEELLDDLTMDATEVIEPKEDVVSETVHSESELEILDPAVAPTVVVEEEDKAVPEPVFEEGEVAEDEDLKEAIDESEGISAAEEVEVVSIKPEDAVRRKGFNLKVILPIAAVIVVAVGLFLVFGLNGAGNEVVETTNNEVAETSENEVSEVSEDEVMESEEDEVLEEGDCTGLDECIELARRYREEGDLEKSSTYFELAKGFVPEEEIPGHVFIWCEHAGVLEMLERWDESALNVEVCSAHTEEVGEGCESVEACVELARGKWEEGAREQASEYYYRAKELVGPNPPPEEHYIWCEHAGVLENLELWEETNLSGAICIMMREKGVTECTDPGECVEFAHMAWDEGNLWLADFFFQWAVDLVPESEHQAFHYIWCKRAEVMFQLERLEEAGAHEEMCVAWEQGE